MTLLFIVLIFLLCATVYHALRDNFVFKTNIELISDFYSYRSVELAKALEKGEQGILDSKTGNPIDVFRDFDNLPSYDDCHYSYGQMMYRYFYVWNKEGFIKKHYR